jgi:hypothetical protein
MQDLSKIELTPAQIAKLPRHVRLEILRLSANLAYYEKKYAEIANPDARIVVDGWEGGTKTGFGNREIVAFTLDEAGKEKIEVCIRQGMLQVRCHDSVHGYRLVVAPDAHSSISIFLASEPATAG